MRKQLVLEHFEATDLYHSKHSPESFLVSLNAPTVVRFGAKHQEYENTSKCRVITTLLHANEPSGFKATFQLAKDGFTPKFTTYVVLASVTAAQLQPLFSLRNSPAERDLNRCFNHDQQDIPGQIAKLIAEFIVEKQPEAVIDVHNTSGSGPPYGVATQQTDKHLALTSHFANRLIFTQMRLGTIMEQELGIPIITIEAGGAKDIEADIVARQGFESFMSCDNPFTMIKDVEILSNPCRLEIVADKTLTFGMQSHVDYDVTLRSDIERFNTGITPGGTVLGWTSNSLVAGFNIKNTDTQIDTYFSVENSELTTRLPLKLFMATSRTDIAKSDCLFYFIV